MEFSPKRTASEWDDLEGASDIISELQDVDDVNFVGDVDYAGSFSISNSSDFPASSGNSNDAWSSDAWHEFRWGDRADVPGASDNAFGSIQSQKHIETSFESLQFSPLLTMEGEDNSDALDLTISDTFGAPFGSGNDSSTLSSIRSFQGANPQSLGKDPRINVNVVVKERLSIIFDGAMKGPICRVVGDLYVKATKRNIGSFCLTVRDKRGNVEEWAEQNSRCRNITASVPHLALDPNDQVFSISLDREHQQESGLGVPIVSYTCIPKLKPMPMLLKTKIHQNGNRCRVGSRIRANPQNSYVLRNIVILIIVPVEFDGENATMSRKGGVWDEIKRTLTWSISNLTPGETVDIQVQFKNNTKRGALQSTAHAAGAGNGLESPKFPVLARCKGGMSFSKIDMNTDYNEDGSSPVGVELERSATVLYRKV
eukprot:jgi/Psemu1/324367/estExt_fgenesh1_pg.C_1390017